MLSFPRPDHAFTYVGRRFGIGRRFAGEVLEANRRDVDVDVYTIEQRAGDATDVSLNLKRSTPAFARRVVPETTWTPLRCPFATLR